MADLHDGRGYTRHSKTIFGTAEDGWLELDRLHISHGKDVRLPTVREAFEMWWLPDATERHAEGDLSKSTYVNHLSRWKLHVGPRWGDVPIGDVRVIDIQSWLLELTASVAESALTLLRQILEFCVRYELTDRNPARGSFRMPKRIDRVYSKDVYSLAEMERALSAVRGSVSYIPAVLCGMGSCRVGESLGARVDLGEVREERVGGMTVAVVDLIRQVDINGRPGEDHRLKTDESERPIVIPEPWSLDVLAQDGPWLCDKGTGAPLSQATVRRHWVADLTEAGIEPIPFRNLRNSWRTFMRWELGVPEDMLEAMMGHAGRNVGEIHYDRPRWEAFARVVVDAWMQYRAGEKASVGTN